jgi:hypothetical protein
MIMKHSFWIVQVRLISIDVASTYIAIPNAY